MHEPEMLTKVNGLMRSRADEFTDEFSFELGKMSGRCIDIGTGAGDVTFDFILPKLNKKSTLLCSDISEAMVNFGKEKYKNENRLSFMVLDIETPNLAKDLIGQFDNLTSLYCLHWCYDLRRAFENIYALLRPGGTSFVTFVASYRVFDAFPILQAIPKYAPYMKDAGRMVPPFQQVNRPRETLMNLLSDIGFEVQNCSCRYMNYIFETRDELKDFFYAAGPTDTKGMPDDMKKEYTKDLAREISSRGIVFKKKSNKNINNNNNSDEEDEYSTLVTSRAFVVYMKKPLNK